MVPLCTFAIIIGLLLVTAALRNWEGIYAILEFELISGLFGEGLARWLAGALGLVFVGLGAWYLMGGG